VLLAALLAACDRDREPPEPETVDFSVATLNVHSHPLTKERSRRLRGIGRMVLDLEGRMPLDVIAFQEAFTAEREELLEVLAAGQLRHHVYFPSGVMGSGLLVVSAHPIVESAFHRYSRNGRPEAIRHGDWYAGKGIAFVRLRRARDGQTLDLFATHMIARYGLDDEYFEDRMAQAREAAAFLGQKHAPEHPAVLVGDLNCWEGTREYGTIVQGASLRRAAPANSEIDHILLREAEGWTFEVRSYFRRPDGGVMLLSGEDGKELSDHPLLACSFEARRQR
jgi:endonuclease/exonuclease/phosphatase family metal-dependent hydrolase